MSTYSRAWIIGGLTGAVLLGAATGVAKAEVAVDLVPNTPGPYVTGQTLTVDVWLHSEVAFDVSLFAVQFDFSNSDPALSLGAAFTFDMSAIATPLVGDYATLPELPLPVVWVQHDAPISAENMLPLPAGESLHIGTIGVQLPADPGTYRLDAMNGDEPNVLSGAHMDTMTFPGGTRWRAFTGELIGGQLSMSMICQSAEDCDDGDQCTVDTCDSENPEAESDACVHEYQVQHSTKPKAATRRPSRSISARWR